MHVNTRKQDFFNLLITQSYHLISEDLEYNTWKYELHMVICIRSEAENHERLER